MDKATKELLAEATEQLGWTVIDAGSDTRNCYECRLCGGEPLPFVQGGKRFFSQLESSDVIHEPDCLVTRLREALAKCSES